MLKNFLAATAVMLVLAGPAFAQSDSNDAGQQANQNQAASGNHGDRHENRKPGLREADASALAMTFYTVVAPADMLASRLIGLDVYNLQNEKVGTIEDLIIDGKTLRAIVISAGGFLGIGDRDVAVAPGSLLITREEGSEDVKVVVNTTRDDLKNAPPFKFEGNLSRKKK